jgi:adenylate cyclase
MSSWISRLAWLIRALTLFSLLIFGIFFTGHNKQPAFYSTFESAYLDVLAQWRVSQPSAKKTDPRITIIDIDETSLDIFGPWPWSRDLIARLIQNTQSHAPIAVGMDIIFPDIHGPAQDQALLQTLKNQRIILGQAFDVAPIDQAPKVGMLAGGQTSPSAAIAWPEAQGYVANSESIVAGLSQEPKHPFCVGHITPSLSDDGVIRHMAPYIRYGDNYYQALTLAMLSCARHSNVRTPLFVSHQGLMTIPWTRSINSYTVLSAKDVLIRRAPADLLKNRWILIGSSALGVGDRVATPLSPILPGVLVHAEILSHILDVDELHGQGVGLNRHIEFLPLQGSRDDWAWLAWGMSILLVLGSLFLITRSHILGTIAFLTLGGIAWLFVSAYLYYFNLYTSWILPWAVMLTLLVIYVPSEWALASALDQRAMKRLGSYVSSDIMRRLIEEGGRDHLLPQRRQITILFVDIANYSAISEHLNPERLSALTEQVLSELTMVVHENAGTLDKYMGDALMAFWGAPVDQPNQADLALDCAQTMVQRVENKALEWQQLFGLLEPIHIHIGINSGDVVVGEFGSDLRKTYTAIGDAVNIAARLQELAKVWQQQILVGQATYQLALRHELSCITEATLRGKHQKELVYSLAPFIVHDSQTH